MNFYEFLTAVTICVYRLVIFAGCAYLVGWHDWSGWWFLLAIIACGISVTTGKDGVDA